MSEANLTVGGGGGVPIRSIAWFPHGTDPDITINGERYLLTGRIETDQSKFDPNIWGDTRGLYWKHVAKQAFGGGGKILLDMESNGAGDVYVGVMSRVSGEDVRTCRSVDGGLNWAVTTQPSANLVGGTFTAVAFGAGKFVFVGDSGKIATSVDGVSLTMRTSPVNVNLNAVKFNGSIFVAVGAGVILTSSDGITWVSRALPVGMAGIPFYSVDFGNNTWVAVQAGYVATAPADGSAWTLRNAGVVAGKSTCCVFFDEETSKFYISAGGACVSSSDGILWDTITATEGPSHVDNDHLKMFKMDGYFYWVDQRSGVLCRSKDLTYVTPIYPPSVTHPYTFPVNFRWAKKLMNGKIYLSQHTGNSLELHQGNTTLFAGSVIKTVHSVNDNNAYYQAFLQGYSRIS